MYIGGPYAVHFTCNFEYRKAVDLTDTLSVLLGRVSLQPFCNEHLESYQARASAFI